MSTRELVNPGSAFAYAVCSCALFAAAISPGILRASTVDSFTVTTAITSSGIAAVNAPNGSATITFRKVFKTSYPEFVEIKVSNLGAGTYDIRALDEEASPQTFAVSGPLALKIFELAGKLHDFQGIDLAVHRRIANLGEKTLRYEKGAEAHEVTFNYTLDDSATQLVNIFEGITRQVVDLGDLQRTMRYDRLGVNDVLKQIDSDVENKLLPEPDQLLQTLDQIAGDEKFLELARQRARTLANRIRSPH
jgi:hypothetical protein